MTEANRQQAEQWNNTSGPVWVEMQGLLDQMLAPFAERLVASAFPGEGRRALDIGCGAGATTLAMAERLGPGGHCVGVDISEPLIAAAKARAAAGGTGAAFLCADAQTHDFDGEAFDAVISRFGVMFFDDPVAAFANIRKASAPGAPLAFVTWRSPAENPFMTTAARALASLLPPMPPPDPNAPGQFAFADPGRVQTILAESGWRDVQIERLDQTCVIPGEDLPSFAVKMGPSSQALRQADAATQAAAVPLLQAAYEPFLDGGVVRFDAACWQVSAKA